VVEITGSTSIVNQKDDVTLEFVGINGANHPTTIAGHDKHSCSSADK
jgi:hypothetical protein